MLVPPESGADVAVVVLVEARRLTEEPTPGEVTEGEAPGAVVGSPPGVTPGSAPWLVASLEWLAHTLEKRWPAEPALRQLYRWIIGAYIYRGFKDGMKELQC